MNRHNVKEIVHAILLEQDSSKQAALYWILADLIEKDQPGDAQICRDYALWLCSSH